MPSVLDRPLSSSWYFASDKVWLALTLASHRAANCPPTCIYTSHEQTEKQAAREAQRGRENQGMSMRNQRGREGGTERGTEGESENEHEKLWS